MKSVVLRKVPYRMAGKSRLLWAFVLAQSQGLALLFVQKPDDNYSHALAIACENSGAGVFEDVDGNRFPVETEDLDDIGGRLEALGDGLTKVDFRKLFKVDED
jgi:hypothetical protein